MMDKPGPFKDTQGRYLTTSLFYETSNPEMREKFPPVYSLKETSDHGLPSAYEIYMGCVDEHEAAFMITGSLRHWRKLCSLKWFTDGLEQYGFDGVKQWREDMKARDMNRAKRQLIDAAAMGDVSAAKKLYDESRKNSVGRPRKEQQVSDGRMAKITELHKKING